jgi:coenzyme F420-dependent glucose-6-phosphate dehydrogenase
MTAAPTPADAPIIGVSLNNLLGITDHTTRIADVLAAAQEAEALGFDAVWLHDAPLGRRTVASYDTPMLLGAIAAVTERVRLCTGILQPHLRNPVMFAVQWGTLSQLSDNRTILGIATGAGKSRLVDREYGALAALQHTARLDPAELYEARRSLFRENVQILRHLWAEDKVTFEGDFYRVHDVTLGEARPPVPPTVLIATGNYYPKDPGGPVHHSWSEKWAGKFAPGPYKYVVNYADGWLTNHATIGELDDTWDKIQEYARRKQPDKQYLKAFNCFVNVDDDAGRAREELKGFLNAWHTQVADDVVDRWGVYGPAEEVARRLREYMDHGVTIFQLVLASADQARQMHRVAEQVLPRVR